MPEKTIPNFDAFRMNTTPKISIVVPCHNEEKNVSQMALRVSSVMRGIGMSYELIFINDGSRDHTLDNVLELARNNSSILVIDLARNFGHQPAVSSGIDLARGEAVVLIDGDLQDPPEVLPEMIAQWQKGYDVVYGQRERRHGDTFFKRLTAAIFYRFLRYCTQTNIPLDTGDFRLMDRKVVEAIKKMPEHHRFIRGMVSWVGFSQVAVRYTRQPRNAGDTNYPFWKMFLFALDAITSFSVLPLRVVTVSGFFIIFLTSCYAFWILILRIFYPELIKPGLAAVNILIAFLGGAQLTCLGVVGEYVGRIYEEAKARPLYLIRNIYTHASPELEKTTRDGR